MAGWPRSKIISIGCFIIFFLNFSFASSFTLIETVVMILRVYPVNGKQRCIAVGISVVFSLKTGNMDAGQEYPILNICIINHKTAYVLCNFSNNS